MKAVIANLDNDWRLTSSDIDAFLRRPGADRDPIEARGGL